MALCRALPTEPARSCSAPTTFPGPVDVDLIRFRVDPALRTAAEAACANASLTLPDILRAFVAQLARTGQVPPTLLAPRETGTSVAQEVPPAARLERRLWAPLLAGTGPELALIAAADRLGAIAVASLGRSRSARAPAGDDDDRDAALAVLTGMDPTDSAAVEQALVRLGPQACSPL